MVNIFLRPDKPTFQNPDDFGSFFLESIIYSKLELSTFKMGSFIPKALLSPT